RASTSIIPSLIAQPLSGKVFLYAPRHPVDDFPSKRSSMPYCFSASDKLLGIVFLTNTPCSGSGFSTVVLIRILRQLICLPSSFLLLIECTCRAIKPLEMASSIKCATGIPFSQVRMEFPMHSIFPRFHWPCLNAVLAEG